MRLTGTVFGLLIIITTFTAAQSPEEKRPVDSLDSDSVAVKHSIRPTILTEPASSSNLMARDEQILSSKRSDASVNLPSPEKGKEDAQNSPVLPQVKPLDKPLPENYKLHPTYPEPSNWKTTIRFDIPPSAEQPTGVELSIYNSLGEKIRVLFEGELQPGSYELNWRADDADGKKIAPGHYYAVFRTEFFQQVVKLTFL